MLFSQTECLSLACEDAELPTGLELEYINNLYKVATENLATIDEMISKSCKGFALDRIYKTDLTAIRLCVAEIKYTQIQPGIAINEAIEIAKKYGTEKSATFVHGVLGKVVG